MAARARLAGIQKLMKDLD